MLCLVFSSKPPLDNMGEFNCAYQNTHSDISCAEIILISEMNLMRAVVSAGLNGSLVVFPFLGSVQRLCVHYKYLKLANYDWSHKHGL